MTYPPIPGVKVLGFAGAARHGKDTAAKFITEIAPPGHIERFAFSDAISAYARVAGGMTKRNPRLLQEVGYALRQTHAGIWLDALYWRIDDIRPRLALVTGVRFPDEVTMVRAMGGTVVWVERLDDDGVPMRVTDRNANYPTETALTRTDCDRVMLNPDGNETLFRQRVCGLYMELFPQSTLPPWKVTA